MNIVEMPPVKDEAKAIGDSIRRQLPSILENAQLLATIRKANFDAYKAAGFNDQQALELCAK